MLQTRRRFNNVVLKVTNDNINDVLTLLDVHGESIKSMRIEVRVERQQETLQGEIFLAIFKKLPNLQKLFLDLYNNNISECQDEDETIILPKLKHLKISFKYEWNSFQTFFNLLPINSITHLEICLATWETAGLEQMMERLSNSVVNLRLYHSLIDSPETFQNMKLKTLIARSFYGHPNSIELNINLLKILNYHPELEKIELCNYFKLNGEVAKALLGMKHLKSIYLKVTNLNWNQVLHEVGRSRINNIDLDLRACNEEKLRIFFNQQYSHINSVRYQHSINATTEVCNNWKGLTIIKIFSENNERIDLNLILDQLPNLQELESWCGNVFNPNGRTYPKLLKLSVGNLTTPPIDLLDALPNVKYLKLFNVLFNVEILRKLAAMKFLDLSVDFRNETETFSATDEMMILLVKIVGQATVLHLNFNVEECWDFEQSFEDFAGDLEYQIFAVKYCVRVYKKRVKNLLDFPFKYSTL